VSEANNIHFPSIVPFGVFSRDDGGGVASHTLCGTEHEASTPASILNFQFIPSAICHVWHYYYQPFYYEARCSTQTAWYHIQKYGE
jgi:hypothetical protein